VLWRSALLAASRNLRQNILRGRIWGNSISDEQGQDLEREELGDVPFTSALYASSSSSLDLPLTGEDAESPSELRPTRRSRVSKNANGHVRGMVDKWERESAGSQSPTRRLGANGRNRYGSESDNGSEYGDEEMAAVMGIDAHVSPFPSNGATLVPAEDDEPSIEDLLAAGTSPSAPKDGSSWGARAWEGLNAGITMRRIEPYDTVVPRRDGSGGSSGGDARSTANIAERDKRRGGNSSSGRCMGKATNKEDPRLARPTVADIFAETPETISTSAHAEAEVQADVPAEMELEEAATAAAVEAELKVKELALEDEARTTRALIEEFKRRLEEVEARVSAMEADWHPPEEQQAPISQQQQQQQQSEAQETSTDDKDTHDDAVDALPKTVGVTPGPAEKPADEKRDMEVDAQNAVEENGGADPDSDVVAGRRVVAPVRHGMVDLGPTMMSDLPSYVLLVGLGVCAVVLQVVLKRVGGHSLRS
jgi:hypothetical protein